MAKIGRPVIDITGQKFGMLVVLRRAEENNSSNEAQWVCLCDCSRETVMTGSHLRRATTKSCGCQRWPMKPAAELGYESAHKRIRRVRGAASAHACVDCQLPALDWSLRREAPEIHWGYKNGSRCPYSGNPDDYAPRCRPCHWQYDNTEEVA